MLDKTQWAPVEPNDITNLCILLANNGLSYEEPNTPEEPITEHK